METSALDNADEMIEKVFTKLTTEIIERKEKADLDKIGIEDGEQIVI